MPSLAVKYRPQDFESCAGQQVTIKILEKQLETNSVGNIQLVCGGSGCGKTTIGRIMASKINKGHGQPIEIDAASNNGVDAVRAIVEDAKLSTATFLPALAQTDAASKLLFVETTVLQLSPLLSGTATSSVSKYNFCLFWDSVIACCNLLLPFISLTESLKISTFFVLLSIYNHSNPSHIPSIHSRFLITASQSFGISSYP